MKRGVSGVRDGLDGEKWYWHSGQGELFKMEVVEALELRKWVVVGLVAGLGILLGVGVWGLMKILRMRGGGSG